MDLRRRHLLLALAAVTLLSLSSCNSGTAGPSMMGGSGSGQTNGPAGSSMMNGFGSMMGSAPRGYHMARLTCSAPSGLPGTAVRVMLGDMGTSRMMHGVAPLGGHMMLRAVPAQAPAGEVSFVVANMGWRTHEFIVLPLAAGQQVGQRMPGPDGRVAETGSLGEASASCAEGEGSGIKAGAVGWVTLTLPPGRYELICNLRNHYANGMRQLFVVT